MAKPTIRPDYEGLYGADFVQKARQNGDEAALETIWRLQDPAASQLVAEPLASLGVARLSDLLLEEALDGKLGPQVAEAVRGAVRQHMPPLTADGSRRLAAWLRDNEPPVGGYTPAREVLEVWLLRQEGVPEVDSFAMDVLTEEFGYEVGGECRAAALDRCRKDPNLAGQVTTRLEAALAEDGDAQAWELGANFVEGMSADRRPPQYLEPLTDRLVASAPGLSQVDEFPEELRRALIQLSAPALKKLLSGDPLGDSPGSRALARLHDHLRRPQERAKAFIDILDTQSVVWRVVGPAVMVSWETDEWGRRLRAIQQSDRAFEEDLLVALMNTAPPEYAALVLRITVDLAEGPEDNLVLAAGDKLGEFLAPTEQAEEEVQAEEATRAIPWWPSGESQVRLGVFDAILRRAVPESEEMLPHVAAALEGGQLSAAEASRFISGEEFGPALRDLNPGSLRRDLAIKLATRDEDALMEAVREIHSGEGFQLDLAEAVAPHSPDTAFLGAGGAYQGLSEVDRGRLVSLLENHGRPEDVPTLDAIVQDTRAANAEYRRRAALRIGEVTPEGGSLPPSVIELLRSNRPELVDAGAAVIGRVKPEEPSLVRLLRSVAIDSEEGSEASVALKSLADTFVGRLSPDLPKDARVQLLNLLAAAATPAVVDPLLSHVGRDALDDDPEVRRLAASGLKEVASQGSLDPDQLSRLVKVIDEERDPTARDDLQAAVSRASLGEDAALETLQELLPFTPKHTLADLLGSERQRVVRHLQLLATERERGEQGRPGVIMQLDIIAERLLRVAYLRYGQSDRLKAEIQASPRTPDYGSLVQALSGVRQLQRIQGPLQTLHGLRSEKTEFTHTGDAPTEEEAATAWTCFAEGAKVIVNALDQD
jgi:hypothetical protein